MKPSRSKPKQGDYIEKILERNRVSKVVQGGRRFSFRVSVVVGDGKGRVGFGIGKGGELVVAAAKGIAIAKRSLFAVPLTAGRSIPHEVLGRFKAARVLLMPASPGTGIIAGHHVRAVAECAGISNLLSKNLRSDSLINVVQATLAGLRNLKNPNPVEKPALEKAPARPAAPVATPAPAVAAPAAPASAPQSA